jgi:hypothetical protein
MAMRAVRTASFLLLIISAVPASATNPGFLPGDCCFLTRLSQDDLKETEKSDSPIFGYDVPDPLAMKLCGFTGYWRLQIPDMAQRQRAALKTAYDRVREFQNRELTEFKDPDSGKVEVVESNPVRVLIVNRDFDFERYGVLGKFNESWPKESLTSTFGGGIAPDGEYVPIVQNADIVIKEWFHGAEVAPLEVELPVPLEATVGKQAPQALKAKKPLRFIVLPEKFEAYVKPEEGTSLFVIDDELTEYKYDPGDGWLKADAWEKRQSLDSEESPNDEKSKSSAGGW